MSRSLICCDAVAYYVLCSILLHVLLHVTTFVPMRCIAIKVLLYPSIVYWIMIYHIALNSFV